jgi:hypothetical protein
LGNPKARLDKLRSAVAKSNEFPSTSLVGENVDEAGVLDRSVLNRHIEEILTAATGNAAAASQIEEHLTAIAHLAKEGDVPGSAGHVRELLSMEIDDLRKAALLSLMVRMTGKRYFDPVAAYVLENRANYATRRG